MPAALAPQRVIHDRGWTSVRHEGSAAELSSSVRRRWHHIELWNGNRESLRTSLFSRDSVIWWAWTTHAPRRSRYARELPHASQRVIRLCSRAEVDTWLEKLRT